MRVLALDTSTLSGSVALVENGRVVAESVAQMRANHSEAVLPMVDEVLTRAGVTLDAVDLLAVGIGPGSFTGVRIGVSLMKGFRLANDKRLAGVQSLDAVCAAAVGASGLVAAVLDGRRGEVFVALYAVNANSRATVLAPSNGKPESMGAAVRAACGDADVLLVGDLDDALWARFEAGLAASGRARRVSSLVGSPLARFVAAEAMAGRCRYDDDDALEPLYVRASDAKLPGQV